MPKIICAYHGTKDEDISIHFIDHHIIFAEQPTQPLKKGLTYGGCKAAYSYLTPDLAENLGKQLIVAAARKRESK